MNNTTLKKVWRFIDTPYDTLMDCDAYYSGDPNASLALCITSSMVGAISIYILPFICIFGIITNIYIGYVFLYEFKKLSRQSIYMSLICWSDAITILFLGILWMIPAKGLPFASEGRIYYFIIYESVELCRFYRGIYSLTSTLASNLLLLTSIDRCLCIYYPLKYRTIPVYYAWYLIGGVSFISFLCVLPVIILVDFHDIGTFTTCWLHESQAFLQIFIILFNNAGFIQTIVILVLNIIFMIKMRKTFTKERLADPQSIESKEWSASVILFILATTLLLFSLPQCAAYLAAFFFPSVMEKSQSEQSVRLAYNIADIAWQCIFAQNASAIFVCWQRMQEFRQVFYRLFLKGPLQPLRKYINEAQSTIH
ncbi:uncharacterized protein DC041_0007852 [Schistosoma bovis]|uniref:G-protein coupled receptors family 1 profile domain-containing protein n=1 Tax=Schistosoma bovis TaxID=6184 RepID=A0A430QKQ5_SCHBO|nr:uncharacterized protein DC041_0007852 [Schistosoma bovis]